LASYQFHFTETASDAMDAYDAVRTASTGMRSWARFLAAALGLFFLFGVAIAIASPSKVSWWQFAIWLGIGSGAAWRFIVEPGAIRRRLRKSPAQPIDVGVSDVGITARVGVQEPVQRYWGELAGVLPASRGLAIGFRDGTISWLPERVFANPAARIELEAFIRSKLPEPETATKP
jgi:hypothetical protein